MGVVFDRILFFLYSLCIALMSVLFILLLFDIAPFGAFEPFMEALRGNVWQQLLAVLVSLLILLISLRLLYRTIRIEAGKPKTVDQRTEAGDLRISLETIESLALKAAAQVKSLQNVRARIQLADKGLEVEVKAYVDGEESIPDRTEEAQRTIRQVLEDVTGVPVAAVSIYIANLTTNQPIKNRVE